GEIVAWVEPNPVRAAAYEARVAAALGGTRPVHHPDDLEKALDEQAVDRVIVTSVDRTHADLVTRALRAGADVVVEKPIAAHPEQARQIVDAVAETGSDLVTTFNYRYSPRNSALREVVASGEIGRVLSVHFDWALDTVHGADYFRRWHREKINNGGLLVHKSSHHFDLVNWWIDGVPQRVFASGGRRFYGDDGAHQTGYAPTEAERALTRRGIDPWALSVEKNEWLSTLYGPEAQAVDGYVRNRSVFDPGITTEDTLGLVVEYAGGAVLTYSLTAHSPWEGYRVVVNGTRGRAELEVVEHGSVASTPASPRCSGRTRCGRRASGSSSSGTGSGPRSGRSCVAAAGTAAATPCCWPTCSRRPLSPTRWPVRPVTSTASARRRWVTRATARSRRATRSASRT